MALPLDFIGLTATEAGNRVNAAAQTFSGEGGTESCEAAPKDVGREVDLVRILPQPKMSHP